MLEYKDDKGNLVKEYTFEDFENGLIGGKIFIGKHHITNSTTGESWYEFMTFENYQKIQEKRKEYYWEKVEKKFQSLKNYYTNTINKSDDKDRFILTELNFYKAIFFPELRSELYLPESYKQGLKYYSEYADLYQNWIVKGNRDYNSTDSPSCQVSIGGGDNHNITVEAFAKYYNWLKEQTNKIENKNVVTKSKLDFTKEKLKPIILELAGLNGYENPSTYLDELLVEIKQFNDFDFECNFFLNIHCLCKENASLFWSVSHRNNISKWFSKARIVTDVFKTTWTEITHSENENTIENENDILVSTIEDYLFDFKDLINKNDYPILVNALKEYFTTGSFPKDCKDIKITGKANVKKFGWALNQLYRSLLNGTLPVEYLQFAKEKISVFKTVPFSNEDYVKTTLYKYFTTKV